MDERVIPNHRDSDGPEIFLDRKNVEGMTSGHDEGKSQP
jgi:hypothetical protein